MAIALPRSEPSSCGRDDYHALQVLATNFILRRKLLDGGQRAKSRSTTGLLLKTVFFDGLERGAAFITEAYSHRVRAAIGYQWIFGLEAVENRCGILGNFVWREAEPRSNDGIHLETCGWAADRVLNSVLHVGDTGDFAEASPILGPSPAGQPDHVEKIFIWIGSGAFERSLIMSCNTWMNSTSSSGSLVLICAARPP